MEDEYLMKCVVDTAKRSFYLYSNEGDEKVVDCDTVEEFMNVLDVVRKTCPEERLVYAEPLSEKT
jgi:imidazoleglycerol phosphate dehydratase HisB